MNLQHIHTVYHEYAPQEVEILRNLDDNTMSLRLIDDGIHHPQCDVHGIVEGEAESHAIQLLVAFNRTVG